MTDEKKSATEQEASKGIGLDRITRRSYLALTAAIGGLIGTGGVGAASSAIEDFERYDGTTTLDDVYSSNIGAFDVVTDTVFEGDQSLYSASSSGAFINSTSGLDTYPAIGDTIEWYTWSRSDAGDRLHFLPQSETGRDNHYSIDHSLRDDRMRIGVYVDGNSEYFAVDSNFTTTRDERWLRHRLETQDTGSAHAFTYEIYEYNPSGDDTLLNSISGSDAEASISDGREFSTGGIGWLVYGRSGTERWFDGLTKVDDGGGGEETTLSVTTAEATEVGESSATLNGSLDDLGGADSADVYFEWGSSGDLSNATAPQTLSATGTFSEELTGLDSGTEYEYRAVAEASDGDTDTGAILSFATGSDGGETAFAVIDDFEQYGSDTTLDDVYSSNIGAFDVVTDTVFEGDQSLYSSGSRGQFINSTSGLDTYPTIGDTIEWYTWSNSGSGDRLHFLPQSETSRDNHYSIDHSLRDDRMRIGVYVNGNSEYFAVDSNFTTTRDQRWLRHRLETEDTGTAHAFTYKIYEYNASGDDTLLNSISGSDAEASISDGREFSTGGIGWLVYGNGGERWFDGLAKVDDDGGGGEETTLSVTTAEATEVGESSATLNGSLDDLGGADSADVYFEWGPSGDLSNATAPQTLSATGTFSEELTKLDSGTEYEYRAVAEASDGDTNTGATLSFTTGSGEAASLISPYYNLAPDPTSQSLIYWIDERDGADGGEQTFAFGTDPDTPDQQYTATGTAVPEKNGIYRYHVDLSGLSQGTTYYGNIVEDGTTLDSVQWSTLPAELPDGGLDIAVYSDIHIDNGDGMGDPTDMIPVRDENPDLILFGGDYITWGDGSTSNRSDEAVVDWWLDLFREWYGTLNESRLHPVLPIPGNHEVGNHSWDGTGSVNPEQGVFQFFYGYPKNLDPVGENYGEVTIGDYLQLLSLDTHSAYPEDVGNWLAGAIDENVLCTIPFHHSPLLTGGNRRVPEDDDLQKLLRDEWLRLLWDDESVLCHFAGHIHLREYTVPYEVVDAEPTSGEYIALDNGGDGYLVADDDTGADRMMQFGTGYRGNRSYDDEWFTDYIAEENQFYSLTLTSTELQVRELDEAGNLYESHTFSTEADSDDGGETEPPSAVIDNFEQYDGTTTLDDVYSNHTSTFDVVTDTVFEGDQSLYSSGSRGQFINSTSGLDTYPAIGDTIEWYTWSNLGSGDRLHFLPQSETSRDNHYSIDHSLRDDRMRIGIYVDGNSEYFAVDSNFTTTRDERWLRHRLETEDTGSAHAFTYEIYEYNPSGEDTLLNSISGSDAEASISDGREFSTGGIGWLVYGNGGERWFDGLAKVE